MASMAAGSMRGSDGRRESASHRREKRERVSEVGERGKRRRERSHVVECHGQCGRWVEERRERKESDASCTGRRVKRGGERGRAKRAGRRDEEVDERLRVRGH